MTLIPDSKLDAWQHLTDSATPGPWVPKHRHAMLTADDDECDILGLYVEGPPEASGRGQFARAADATFIATAREAMPELLAAYREAVALLGTYHQALKRAQEIVYTYHAVASGRGNQHEVDNCIDVLEQIAAALSADGAQAAKRQEALETVAEALKACEDERQKAEERRGPASILGVPVRQSPSPELYFAAIDALTALERGKQPR